MREGDRLAAPAVGALARGPLGAGSLPAIALAVGLLVLLGVPFVGSGYVVRFLTELFMLIVLAQAWNLVGGLSGYISFGHVVFFGLGAYTTGLLMERLGLPFAVA